MLNREAGNCWVEMVVTACPKHFKQQMGKGRSQELSPMSMLLHYKPKRHTCKTEKISQLIVPKQMFPYLSTFLVGIK